MIIACGWYLLDKLYHPLKVNRKKVLLVVLMLLCSKRGMMQRCLDRVDRFSVRVQGFLKISTLIGLFNLWLRNYPYPISFDSNLAICSTAYPRFMRSYPISNSYPMKFS